MPYTSLDQSKIIATTEKLTARIEKRFGARGLTKVAQELCKFAREDVRHVKRISSPHLLLRLLVTLVLLGGLAALAFLAWTIKIDFASQFGLDMFQGLDALINILIVIGVAAFFFLNLESRQKREAILHRLNKLRSIAHVIDMHQLSKDPMSDLHIGETSESAPESDLHGYELVRYLDYCADLLAVTGKLAAVYLEHSDDPTAISAVNEFESLTGEMARKIWQKVTVLELQTSTNTSPPQLVTRDKKESVSTPQTTTHEKSTLPQQSLELPDFLK